MVFLAHVQYDVVARRFHVINLRRLDEHRALAGLYGDAGNELALRPGLTEQCQWLDWSIYHLDGEHAMCHLDALLEIDALDAIIIGRGGGSPEDLAAFNDEALARRRRGGDRGRRPGR